MRIFRNALLLSRTKYNMIRVFILVWTCLAVLFLFYWNSLSLRLKIIFSIVLGYTTLGSFWDIFISYDSYKVEWEKINGKQRAQIPKKE